jgi:hypothetical protein
MTLAWVLVASANCTDSGLRQAPLSTPIPISEIKRVAGKWEGVRKSVPTMRDDAEVILIIQDNGTFEFVGNRGNDILVGAGTLVLQNGKLTARTVRLDATMSLHDRGGKSVLVVDAIWKDGNRYRAELSPLQEP